MRFFEPHGAKRPLTKGARRHLLLARAHHFFVFAAVAVLAQRLERAVDAVSGVAEAGNDVGGLVEMIVDGARINMNVGVLLGQ